VTFSSDSHAPAEVGWVTTDARPCSAGGVREFVTFESRRKIFHPLPGATASS
jgi:hypothetical protein